MTYCNYSYSKLIQTLAMMCGHVEDRHLKSFNPWTGYWSSLAFGSVTSFFSELKCVVFYFSRKRKRV